MSYLIHTQMTCRFCKESGSNSAAFVKYGVRHYAHWRCYLASGRALDDLHDWQIAAFPYRLIKEYGLEDIAMAAAQREQNNRSKD